MQNNLLGLNVVCLCVCVARFNFKFQTGEKYNKMKCVGFFHSGFCCEEAERGKKNEVKCLNRGECVCVCARQRVKEIESSQCNIMRFLFSSIHCSIAIIEFVHFIYAFFLLFCFHFTKRWISFGWHFIRLSFMWIVLWYCLLPIHLPLININSTAHTHTLAHTAHSPEYARESVKRQRDRIWLKSYRKMCKSQNKMYICSEAQKEIERVWEEIDSIKSAREREEEEDPDA